MTMFLSHKEKKIIKWSVMLMGKLILSIISFIFAIILLSFQLIRNSYKWVKNYIHFRKIHMNYLQIQQFITHLTGRQFEVLMYLLFKANGQKVKLTQASADGGKDLIIYDKRKGTTYVELKQWSKNWKVGRPELQKLVGTSVGDRVKNNLFITTGLYSNEAIEYAKKLNNLNLWDMIDIMDLINKTDVKKLPYIFTKTKITGVNKEFMDTLGGINDSIETVRDEIERL